MDYRIVFFVALVVAVIPHEVMHGVVALWFGDDTAKRAGRLTLNPIPHIDPFGTVILPALGALTGIPVLIFAKPVPVSPNRLRNPRRDMLAVSLAGPFTNFALMVVAALLARSFAPHPLLSSRYEDLPLGVEFLVIFATVNMFLGLFNLLPIPPLDGSAILERALPRDWLPVWYRIRPYGMLVLFLAVFSFGFPGNAFTPFLHRLNDFILG